MKQDHVAPDEKAPTASPFKQVSAKAAALIASTALAVSSCAQTPTTSTKENSAPKITLTDSVEDYKDKVAKMSEAELRTESDALAKIIQPMMDAGASDEELLPYLTKHDIVGNRLDPIIEANIAKQDKIISENNEVIAENKEAIKELNYAGEIFTEIREKLQNPEKVDWDETMKNLQLAVNILKKHNGAQ